MGLQLPEVRLDCDFVSQGELLQAVGCRKTKLRRPTVAIWNDSKMLFYLNVLN